jgi:circadian clock protein KaiC
MRLGGEGFYRGTTILVSGTAGTASAQLRVSSMQLAARQRCLALVQESLASWFAICINWTERNNGQEKPLTISFSRATLYGLEMHLAIIHKTVRFEPKWWFSIRRQPYSGGQPAGAHDDSPDRLLETEGNNRLPDQPYVGWGSSGKN